MSHTVAEEILLEVLLGGLPGCITSEFQAPILCGVLRISVPVTSCLYPSKKDTSLFPEYLRAAKTEEFCRFFIFRCTQMILPLPAVGSGQPPVVGSGG